MTQEELFGLLHEVAHPELHNDIVTLGMVENPVVTDDKIQLTLLFPRSRDPFALSIKKRCEELIAARFPDYSGKISIFIKEAAPKKAAEKRNRNRSAARTASVASLPSVPQKAEWAKAPLRRTWRSPCLVWDIK